MNVLVSLLTVAWLLPLASFVAIALASSITQHVAGRGNYRFAPMGGWLATGAIVTSCALSLTSLFFCWLPTHPIILAEAASHRSTSHDVSQASHSLHADAPSPEQAAIHEAASPAAYSGDWYALVEIGRLRLTLGYYVDALTVAMFTMVTLIASCVHVYSVGYMHDELGDFTDPEVTLENGDRFTRTGRYHRFFQYLSLFSFSMLGLVIAGNLAMVFVFWELVGICSYFLIGFYIERKSASDAANKAFIVNRIGDFGMLIGMMALWASLGTFAFGDGVGPEGEVEHGLFSQLRTEERHHRLAPPDGMIMDALGSDVAGVGPGTDLDAIKAALSAQAEIVRRESGGRAGYWLLTIAGLGVFCGCVGKSAQFPLHVWLPDAMEGPTPVSALVHSATMVAAGVYLVGRFYPVFTPEALLTIAYVGCVTLALAATIAVTATDIKRVLAYSTVSQLGYMMLALGVGGWLAGLFHLITHAFFKGLLFLCSGSVIHAVHTNEMTEMGGLRKKMPITATTMLIGCLAIIGAGLPTVGLGLSGYFSKDAILEQAFSFAGRNPSHAVLYWAPLLGAGVTAFYMFRLWFMTFAGKPRDPKRFAHAHESPRVMTAPLTLLALFAIGIGWSISGLSVTGLLEQARPAGTLTESYGLLVDSIILPNEHDSHADEIRIPVGWSAFIAAFSGVSLAAVVYVLQWINPSEVARTFRPVYALLWNKWWFDELYQALFVRPTMFLAKMVSWFDRHMIDALLHRLVWLVRKLALIVGLAFDRHVIDGLIDGFAGLAWKAGLSLRRVQTGSLRGYVVSIVAGTLLLFLAATAWRYAFAG